MVILDILKQKKGGKFNIIQIDPAYETEEIERRSIFGIEFIQKRNSYIPSINDLKVIVTENKELPEEAKKI